MGVPARTDNSPLSSGTPSTSVDDDEEADDTLGLDAVDAVDLEPKDEGDKTPGADTPTPLSRDGQPKKVFIAHGKNRTPLDQLKNALDTFKVRYIVEVVP